MSMNLGDWEISLRRHGLGGDIESATDCADDPDAVSTRVSTANTQSRYAEGLAEVQEEEPFETFDLSSRDEVFLPVTEEVQEDVSTPQETAATGEAVTMISDDVKEESKPEPVHRRRKVIKKIFKAIPVRISFGASDDSGRSDDGETKPPTADTEVSVPIIDDKVAESLSETPSELKPQETSISPKESCVLPKPPPVVNEPLQATLDESKSVETSSSEPVTSSKGPTPSQCIFPLRPTPSIIPALRLSETPSSATVIKKYSHAVAPSRYAVPVMKALETHSSQSSHEPFSGMSEPTESQSVSFQASPLALERLPSNTERADRDEAGLHLMHLSLGSSTTREKTGSPLRADFPCQFIDVPEGSVTPPTTLDMLRGSSQCENFKSLTSLIYVKESRLLVRQAFRAREVIAVVDPVLLCCGRDRSCYLGMARHVPKFAKKPGFPVWADSNASFVDHMSLTISRQEPKGNVLKGVYPYCHLLFKTNAEPNVECHFHGHQIVLVALTTLPADTPLAANMPPCNTPPREIKSKLFRSCSTNISEPFAGTGSRADINHFSLHAETERYSARKTLRKEASKPCDAPKKELAPELSSLTTESTETSRDVADGLSERLVTEEICETVAPVEQTKHKLDKADGDFMSQKPFNRLMTTGEESSKGAAGEDRGTPPIMSTTELIHGIEAAS